MSYTVEILPFALRAKGFTVFNFAISLSLIFNQYVNPIALGKIHWKYYVSLLSFPSSTKWLNKNFAPNTACVCLLACV